MADSETRRPRERREVEENDLIQVNEDGPAHWFRCVLVVDRIWPDGIQAYCTIPDEGDRYIGLAHHEFDVLGVRSRFLPVKKVTA